MGQEMNKEMGKEVGKVMKWMRKISGSSRYHLYIPGLFYPKGKELHLNGASRIPETEL